MHLTTLLRATRLYTRKTKTPGLQWIGKHRRFRPITENMLANMRRRLAIEEENAKHLSTPFLSKEEDATYADHIQAESQANPQIVVKPLKPHKLLDTHFTCLNATKKWED